MGVHNLTAQPNRDEAQRFDRIQQRIDAGDFLRAASDIKPLAAKAGTQGASAARANFQQFQIYAGLYRYNEAEVFLTRARQAVPAGKGATEEDIKINANLLLGAVRTWSQHGWPTKARQSYEALQALPIPQGSRLEAGLKPAMANAEIEMLREEGFYKQAIARSRDQQVWWNNQRGQAYPGMAWPNSTYKDKEAAKRLEAETRILEASAILSYGDYNVGKNAMENAIAFAGKTLHKKDALVLQGYYWLGRAELKQDNYKQAARLTQKAIKSAGSRRNYTTMHPDHVRALYQAALAQFRQGDLGGAVKNIDRLEDLYIARFDRVPHVGAMMAMLAYEEMIASNALSPMKYKLTSFVQTPEAVLPIGPATYNDLLHRLQLAQLERDSIRLALGVQNEIDRMLEAWPKNSPQRHIYLLESAYFHALMNGQFRQAGATFAHSWNQVVAPELHPQNPNYVALTNLYGRIEQLLDHFTTSRALFEKNLALVKQHHGEGSHAYAAQLEKLGRLELDAGRFSQAEALLKDAIGQYRKLEGRRSYNKLRVEQSLGRLYAEVAQYDRAEDLLKDATDKLVPEYFNLADYSPEGSEDLARIYMLQGNFRAAERELKYAMGRRTIFGNKNYLLSGPQTMLATLYLEQGDLTQAERYARQSGDIAATTFGDSSLTTLRARLVQQRALSLLGDKNTSMQLAEQNVATLRTRFSQSLLYAEALTDHATTSLQNKGYSAEAESQLVQAKNLTASLVGTSHPAYGYTLKNHAAAMLERKQLDSAAQMLSQATGIVGEKLGKRTSAAADLLVLQGDVDAARGDYKSSEKAYSKARDLYGRLFDKNHPRYVSCQARLARLQYSQGKRKDALSLLGDTRQANLRYMHSSFPYLSERERNEYWQLLRTDFEFFNSVALRFMEESPRLAGDLLENSMASKSVLLNAQQKVRNRIMSSPDTALTNRYSRWQANKEELLSLQNIIMEGEAAKRLDALQKAVDNDERELARLSQAFASTRKLPDYDWKDIRNQLQTNEYLVDIVRFRYFDQQFTDSIIYMALVLGPKMDAPAVVVLPKGKQLETRNVAYYRNAFRHRIADERTYNLFWRDIKARIPDQAVVYLCNDGVYHQLNPETFLNPKTNKYGIDENTFIHINNPLEITQLKRKPAKAAPTAPLALLVGNPQYYGGRLTAAQADSLRDAGFFLEPLPGTVREASTIGQLLQASRYQCVTARDSAATERWLKRQASPAVLHIASHGVFFAEPPLAESRMSMRLLQPNIDNSLQRTGLALAGAGDLLTRGPAAMNREDGILTANEAMTLDLNDTELVVLSACETGLGTVQAGEGVFGLQRALQVAGARCVVISLFKVDDSATAQLMQDFYKRWLATNDKRNALADAKRELKKQYPDPVYWGGFVLLGI